MAYDACSDLPDSISGTMTIEKYREEWGGPLVGESKEITLKTIK